MTAPRRWADWGETVDPDGVPLFPDPPSDLLERYRAEAEPPLEPPPGDPHEPKPPPLEAGLRLPAAGVAPLAELLVSIQEDLLPRLREHGLTESYERLVVAVDDIIWNPAFAEAVELASEYGFTWDVDGE